MKKCIDCNTCFIWDSDDYVLQECTNIEVVMCKNVVFLNCANLRMSKDENFILIHSKYRVPIDEGWVSSMSDVANFKYICLDEMAKKLSMK